MLGATALIGTTLYAPAAHAVASTLYVGAHSCSDTGSGTQTQPYCTIAKAAAVAVAGQTVEVAAGSYGGGITLGHSGSAGAPITVRSASGATVQVTGGVNGFLVSGKSYVTISGFTVSGTTSYGIAIMSSNHVTVSGNTVTGSGKPVSGQTAAGIYLAADSASVVAGNTADRNSSHGIYLTTGTTSTEVSGNEASFNAEGYRRNANGISVIGPGNVVSRNVTHDNEDSGIEFYPGGNGNLATLNVTYNNGDHGIDNLNVTGGRIIGNTVYHNCTTGINVEGTSGTYLVVNNIAVDNAVYPAYNGVSCSRRAGNIGIWDSAPSSTTVDHNLVYLSKAGTMYVFGSGYTSLAAMQAATGQERHGVQADPRFGSAGSGGFPLRSGSPAIDIGTSSPPDEPSTDLLGHPRVDVASVPNSPDGGPRPYDDLGAYEFQG
ncbi:MAG TPA: right-handed parallel beta-helix repeat-containing protein [Kineosporiaceae bacterium]